MREFSEATYEELYQALAKCTPEQRQKKIQILPPNPNSDVPSDTLPVYAIGTVEELCDPEVGIRTHYDGRNHLDDVVLVADWNPYT